MKLIIKIVDEQGNLVDHVDEVLVVMENGQEDVSPMYRILVIIDSINISNFKIVEKMNDVPDGVKAVQEVVNVIVV